MEAVLDALYWFFGNDLKAALLIVVNLIIIESLLSVDNAAVLATMVMDLPEKQRRKALRIGLVFAYIFRGACLVFASVLIQVKVLKLIGGGYLLFLCLRFFQRQLSRHQHIIEQEKEDVGKVKRFYFLNQFWSTVLMVESMDLVFSIDNVLAAVAYTDRIQLVMLGVFIGIITMRIVAGYFVVLMEKFPFLDSIAFIVIGILGLKLMLSFACESNVLPHPFCELLESETADTYFSLITLSIFVLPILSSYFLNYPKRGTR